MTKELEWLEPEFLIGEDGKLSSGVISLLHSAFGYSVSSLTKSTWIVNTDAKVSGWSRLTGHPEASVKGTYVMFNKDTKLRMLIIGWV